MIPGYTSTITVVAASTVAGLFIVDQPPASVQAGAGFGLVVGAEDQFGNPTALTGSVSVAILNNPGGSTLGGTTTVTASGGVATFSGLTLNMVGHGYTLQASDSLAGTATTSGINVTPAPATQLVIPASRRAARERGRGPGVLDGRRRRGSVRQSRHQLHGLGDDRAAEQHHGSTTVTAINGVATFSDLVIDTAGTYQLQATQRRTDLGHLSYRHGHRRLHARRSSCGHRAPGQVLHGVGFGATVDVEDQFGNLETAFNGSVTVALDINPGDATLGGTTTVKRPAAWPRSPGSRSTPSATVTRSWPPATASPRRPRASINVTPIPAVGLKVTTQPPTSVQVDSDLRPDGHGPRPGRQPGPGLQRERDRGHRTARRGATRWQERRPSPPAAESRPSRA